MPAAASWLGVPVSVVAEPKVPQTLFVSVAWSRTSVLVARPDALALGVSLQSVRDVDREAGGRR